MRPLGKFLPWEDKARLFGSTGVGSCTGINNRRTFGFPNQLSGSFAPATELDHNRFWPLAFGGLVRHLSTQVNENFLSAYITVNLSRGLSLVIHPLSS